MLYIKKDSCVKSDLNEIKQIFLKTIDENYAKLSYSDSIKVSPQTISSEKYLLKYLGSFFSENSDEIKLKNLEKDENKDYSKAHPIITRHPFTWEKDLETLKNFFVETNSCENTCQFFRVVLKYYQFSETKFCETLKLAIGASAKINFISKLNPEEKKGKAKLSYIAEQLYPNKFEKDAKILIGDTLIKEMQGKLMKTEETLQQQLYRKDPTIYCGNKEAQQECDYARDILIEASLNSTFIMY